MFYGISMHMASFKEEFADQEKSKTSLKWNFEAWTFFAVVFVYKSFCNIENDFSFSRLKKKQRFNLWRQKFMASLHARGVEIEEVSFSSSLFSCLNCPVLQQGTQQKIKLFMEICPCNDTETALTTIHFYVL